MSNISVPEKSAVQEEPGRAPAPRGGLPFWAAFYLWPAGRTSMLFYWLFGFLPLTLTGFTFGFLVAHTPDAARYLLPEVILFIWPQWVVLARRFHDINMTGWWVALFWALPAARLLLHAPVPPGTVAMVGWLGAIVIGLVPGTRGANRYGSDPMANPGAARV